MVIGLALVEAKSLTGAREYTKDLNPRSGFNLDIKYHPAFQRTIRPASTTEAPLRSFGLIVVVNSVLLISQPFLFPSQPFLVKCVMHFLGILASKFLVSTLELV